ncbi:LytTR family DNA-binding domain-containing protein [Acholeplasma granularum]|uniref:LytTR family DNA-binding domain-containing protein n=1 Tax=Acholeplasma granularum TaxID=264635 RepID=UPI00047203F2|nr:LytTR family DNA-binding domain-containing protein [Acholeplasma granularum]
MIKVILNKDDLSIIDEDIKSSNILVSNLNDNEVALVLDENSYNALELILKKIQINKKNYLFQTSDGWVKLNIGHILYIESFGTDIIIHTLYDGKVLVKHTLYQLEELLNPYHIIRIGKSFLVNLSKVVYIKTKLNAKLELELIGGLKLDVTRSYVKSFKNALGIGG